MMNEIQKRITENLHKMSIKCLKSFRAIIDIELEERKIRDNEQNIGGNENDEMG